MWAEVKSLRSWSNVKCLNSWFYRRLISLAFKSYLVLHSQTSSDPFSVGLKYITRHHHLVHNKAAFPPRRIEDVFGIWLLRPPWEVVGLHMSTTHGTMIDLTWTDHGAFSLWGWSSIFSLEEDWYFITQCTTKWNWFSAFNPSRGSSGQPTYSAWGQTPECLWSRVLTR